MRCLVAFLLSALAAPCLAEEPRAEKKIIEWGWDEPDTVFLRANIEAMEQYPFDGLVFHVNSSRGGNFTWEMWGGRRFEFPEFQRAVDNLKATRFRRFTERFLRVNVTPGGVDWFDDEAWSTVANNFAVAAQVAKQGDCTGFMFDVEQYEKAPFNYSSQPNRDSRPLPDYRAQVRKRGREWIASVNRHFPDITILVTFGYRIAQPRENQHPSEAHYGLLADFLDGVLEACSQQTKIVDAWEYSYPYKERRRFEEAYATIREDSAAWTALPERYRRHVRAGFGLWMDCRWREVGWSLDDFSKNHFTPEEFHRAVRSALEVSDRYVWVYTEQPRWWTGERLPAEYVEALRRARLRDGESGIAVRVVYDNYAGRDDMPIDWGFACLVTGLEKTILFDSGAKGELLLANLEKMGFSPKDVDVIVISHNHADHTGGLLPVLEENPQVSVFLPAGTPEGVVEAVRGRAARTTLVGQPIEVCRGARLIGPMGDQIVEQALAVDGPNGLAVITGCAHPGIVAIVKRAKEELRREPDMILGGTHLLKHAEDELEHVIEQLKSLGVGRVAATHCTGEGAIAAFREAFGEGFVEMGTGRVIAVGAE